MIRCIDLRGRAATGQAPDYRALVPRPGLDIDAALEAVRPICADVRDRGATAVREYTSRFDGVDIDDLKVPVEALTTALASLSPAVRAALEESITRARRVHEAQRRDDRTTAVVPGGTVTEKWVPVGRVGLYVPGGLAVYPSSVVMNVVPAQAAGVETIAVASPPQKNADGLPDSTILAACALLGVDEVFAVGGAQAVAMFAYGVRDDTGTWMCAPVDLVTGPGNVYVAAAKRHLKGIIGIDAEAGPTEIAVLADDSADPEYVAADLVSQAEHDPLAASVLVTASVDLADAVAVAVKEQAAAAAHSQRVAQALGGEQSGIVLVDDLGQGIDVINAYAAEHVEVQTQDPRSVADQIHNAGAIFVGPWAPVSLGDYAAGSNHVLPTGGSARHASGLSVHSFLKGIHVIEYDETALADVAHHVDVLADTEQLPAHGAAVRVRFRR